MTSDDVLTALANASTERRLELLSAMPQDQELRPGLTAATALEALCELHSPVVARPGSGCELRQDVVYGTAGAGGRALTLHLYVPGAGRERPGVVFVHGGGWAGGHPARYSDMASALASEGYVAATISYRLSGEACWPAALEDAKCAVRWLRAHAFELEVDPTRIAIAGGSSGGHLAAMVALTPGRYEGTGGWNGVSSEVQAAVLYCPALDLRGSGLNAAGRQAARMFLSNENFAAEASPVTHVSRACPPLLTRVGDQDQVTPVSVARAFHKILEAEHVPNQLEIVAGKKHDIIVSDRTGCMNATVKFLTKNLPEDESSMSTS